MNCLITGGAGFIGSHLSDALIAKGHRVIIIDNLLTGSRENIAHLIQNPHVTFLEGDVSNEICDTVEAQVIFHLASVASPPKYVKYPVETLLVNTVGTHKLLEKARLWGAKFIFASTSEVYGDPLKHPQKETYWGNTSSTGPRSCYDEAKRCGESFVMAYYRTFGVDASIVRIFNTYGPRMDIDDGRVVTNFIKQILTKEPLTIYGDGSQTRSFCYVSDLVAGLLKVFETKGISGEVFNLGNTHEKTIKQFAQIVADIAKYPHAFTYGNLPQDDPIRRKPDISKAKKILGWEPKVDLVDGLKKTYSYFKQQQNT